MLVGVEVAAMFRLWSLLARVDGIDGESMNVRAVLFDVLFCIQAAAARGLSGRLFVAVAVVVVGGGGVVLLEVTLCWVTALAVLFGDKAGDSYLRR